MYQRVLRPKVGLHAIAVGKIKTNGRSTPEQVDAMMSKVEDEGVPNPLPVTWDPYDWKTGHVFFAGDPSIIIAVRELGHVVLNCMVKIDPESGMQADDKEIVLEVEVKEVVDGSVNQTHNPPSS